MGVGLETPPICRLQFTKFIGLGLMRVDREAFINEEIPDFLSSFAGVKRLVLRVTDAAEFLIGGWRLSAVTLSDELDYSFALINLLTKQSAEISAFRSKYILPNRLIAEKRERVCDELSSAAKFATDCRNED